MTGLGFSGDVMGGLALGPLCSGSWDGRTAAVLSRASRQSYLLGPAALPLGELERKNLGAPKSLFGGEPLCQELCGKSRTDVTGQVCGKCLIHIWLTSKR